MLFAVLFEDDPACSPTARESHMGDHLAFLAAHEEKVLAAGPLLDEGQLPTGGLWIVEADGPEEVEELVHADPFWPTGLRKTVEIRPWRQVFPPAVTR